MKCVFKVELLSFSIWSVKSWVEISFVKLLCKPNTNCDHVYMHPTGDLIQQNAHK